MDIWSVIVTNNTTLTAIITLGLGIWVYYDRRNDAKHVTLGTMLVTVSAWTFSLVLWSSARQPQDAVFWVRTLFFLSSLIPLLFLVFILSFVRGRLPSLKLQLALAVPNVALSALAYFTSSLAALDANARIALDWGRLIFASHFSALLVVALLVLFRSSRRMKEGDRPKLVFILIGAIIAFNSVFGVLYGTNFTEASTPVFIANVGLVIGMFVMASSVLQKKFLAELRLLGPQLFSLIALFAVIFNIVVTQRTIDFALQLTIIVILGFYAALTTMTLVQEVRRMQRVEQLGDQAFKMNDELIKADKLKSQFVSFASHQLRSPIAGISASLQMLRRGEAGAEEERKKILETSITALGRLAETINTFLDATKIQLGKLELFKTEASLADLVRRAVEELRPLAAEKGLALKTKIAEGVPDVSCDEGKILHVLVNLIDNAIKYSEKGGVTVSVAPEGEAAVVRVADTGIGLSEEERAGIFTAFKRGMEAVRFDTGGSGLGLYIVKNILDAHGAGIIVESAGRGKGSTFGFRLPAS